MDKKFVSALLIVIALLASCGSSFVPLVRAQAFSVTYQGEINGVFYLYLVNDYPYYIHRVTLYKEVSPNNYPEDNSYDWILTNMHITQFNPTFPVSDIDACDHHLRVEDANWIEIWDIPQGNSGPPTCIWIWNKAWNSTSGVGGNVVPINKLALLDLLLASYAPSIGLALAAIIAAAVAASIYVKRVKRRQEKQ